MAMVMRMELFVEDVGRSVAFYRDVLGFRTSKADEQYMGVQNGNAIFGICQRRALPGDHYFTQAAFEERKGVGVGVEIVLEVEDLQALYTRVMESGYPIHEELQGRPWGSTDFRLIDPDGYYLRLTD